MCNQYSQYGSYIRLDIRLDMESHRTRTFCLVDEDGMMEYDGILLAKNQTRRAAVPGTQWVI